jgi:hypothetical protein
MVAESPNAPFYTVNATAHRTVSDSVRPRKPLCRLRH